MNNKCNTTFILHSKEIDNTSCWKWASQLHNFQLTHDVVISHTHLIHTLLNSPQTSPRILSLHCISISIISHYNNYTKPIFKSSCCFESFLQHNLIIFLPVTKEDPIATNTLKPIKTNTTMSTTPPAVFVKKLEVSLSSSWLSVWVSSVVGGTSNG
jgi:hypothetical protein